MTAYQTAAATVAALLALWGLLWLRGSLTGRRCPACGSRWTEPVAGEGTRCVTWACPDCLHEWYVFRFKK